MKFVAQSVRLWTISYLCIVGHFVLQLHNAKYDKISNVSGNIALFFSESVFSPFFFQVRPHPTFIHTYVQNVRVELYNYSCNEFEPVIASKAFHFSQVFFIWVKNNSNPCFTSRYSTVFLDLCSLVFSNHELWPFGVSSITVFCDSSCMIRCLRHVHSGICFIYYYYYYRRSLMQIAVITGVKNFFWYIVQLLAFGNEKF